jgi:hypothetical protein
VAHLWFILVSAVAVEILRLSGQPLKEAEAQEYTIQETVLREAVAAALLQITAELIRAAQVAEIP